jgi:hypothetical protein
LKAPRLPNGLERKWFFLNVIRRRCDTLLSTRRAKLLGDWEVSPCPKSLPIQSCSRILWGCCSWLLWIVSSFTVQRFGPLAGLCGLNRSSLFAVQLR